MILKFAIESRKTHKMSTSKKKGLTSYCPDTMSVQATKVNTIVDHHSIHGTWKVFHRGTSPLPQ